MSARLIINADDFGLTPGINRAVKDLFRAGALSSATLMATGPAFDDAIAIAQAHAGLGVGCHVVLLDGVPVLPPEQIPSLLDPACSPRAPRFRPSLVSFYKALLLGQIRATEVELEISAQLQRMHDAGVRPTHLDSHKHVHMLPAVLGSLLRVSEQWSIPAIRNPFEATWAFALGAGGARRRVEMKLLAFFASSFGEQIAHSRLGTPCGAIGVSTTGTLGYQTLAPILENLPDGTWELVCHPGYVDDALGRVTTRLRHEREEERSALQSLVPRWRESTSGSRLVSFRALHDRTCDDTPAPAAVLESME